MHPRIAAFRFGLSLMAAFEYLRRQMDLLWLEKNLKALYYFGSGKIRRLSFFIFVEKQINVEASQVYSKTEKLQ